jgi:hypothetical protein
MEAAFITDAILDRTRKGFYPEKSKKIISALIT